MKQKRINVPLQPETHRAVKTAAAQRGVSIQKLVQSTLAASFAFQTPPPQRQQGRTE